ncbi:MAG: hypothetical protein ACP6IT_05910 [Candidatus Thorarchaeota archaeon]
MSVDMAKVQSVISQALKRAGLESISVISSLGIPVASVGIGLDLGVQARTIFAVFDRAASMLGLGQAEHVCIDGNRRSFIVKPIRRGDSIVVWFVAVAPTFGGHGVFEIEDLPDATRVGPGGVEAGDHVPDGHEEAELVSAVMALWSAVPMLMSQVNLGDVNGVYLDGNDGRVVVRPLDADKWLVAFPPKERRVGRVDVELDRAAAVLVTIL